MLLTRDTSEIAQEVLTIVPSVIGPRLGADTQKVIAAIKRGEWKRQLTDRSKLPGISVHQGEYSLVLHPSDERSARALADGAGVVSVDLVTTEALEREGLAGDLVRLVQAARRDAGLHISDRIHLMLTLPEDMAEAARHHRIWLMEQTWRWTWNVTVGPSVEIDLSAATGRADYRPEDGSANRAATGLAGVAALERTSGAGDPGLTSRRSCPRARVSEQPPPLHPEGPTCRRGRVDPQHLRADIWIRSVG